MASSKDYLTYVLDLLREVRGISFKKMMGEYILYKDDVIFGGIYDDRFLVKKCDSLNEYEFKEQIPYPGGRPMLLVDIENPNELKDIVQAIYNEMKR